MNTFLKKYNPLLLIALFTISLSSCEKEIDVDLKSVTPRIVIEGIVKQNELAKVRVTQTIDFDDNSGYPNLKGAIVKISDNAGKSEVLEQDGTGWYVAKEIIGVMERTYSMSVTYEGKEYTSTSTMPPHVKLDSVTMYKVPIMDYAFPMVHFQDPIGETNQYYRALFFVNGKQLPDVQEFVLSADKVDGTYYHQFLPVTTHDDDNDPINKGDEITIELQCIDKGTFTYFDSLNRGKESSTNPISNITGGSLGYFSACTAEQVTIIANWEK